jgi:hypothetical protein
MTSRDLTQHAALSAQIAAMPADFVGYGLLIEAMLHRLEGYPLRSRETDLRWTLEQASDVVHSYEDDHADD